MNIEHIAERFKEEMPGYDLVGYRELGFPMFIRTLHCLIRSKQRLPVVNEFVLFYCDLGLDIEDIKAIMAIDPDVIDEAWWDLEQNEFIDGTTLELRPLGKEYLQQFKADSLEKYMLNVSIDGLLGRVEKDVPQMMSNKRVKEIGLNCLRSLTEFPNVDNINIQQVQRTFKVLQKHSEDGIDADIIDVFHLEGSTTKYKRLNVLAFSDRKNSTRLLVYDGFQEVKGYEDALMELDSKGYRIVQANTQGYFISDKIHVIDELVKSKDNIDILGPGKLWDEWKLCFEQARNTFLIVLPLIEICKLDDFWLEQIEEALEKNVKVNFVVSGRQFTSWYQKAQYEKLLMLKKKYSHLNVCQIPDYTNKIIIRDNQFGVISSFKKYSLFLPSSAESVVEYGYSLMRDDLSNLFKALPFLSDIKDSIAPAIPWSDKKMLRTKIERIIGLITELDDYLVPQNNIGWIGDEQIPEMYNMLNLPVALDENTFKIFINTLNKSLVEVLELNAKKKGKRNYFWEDFKTHCPQIQRNLHKVKLYRHSMHHIDLEERYKPLYHEFLNEDLEGSLPQFVDKGFLMLQVRLIDCLEVSLLDQLRLYR